jgi:hypothetical protein
MSFFIAPLRAASVGVPAVDGHRPSFRRRPSSVKGDDASPRRAAKATRGAGEPFAAPAAVSSVLDRRSLLQL